MNYLINILLGFAIAQLIDIMKRNRESDSSPIKFNIVFFLKDNWQKILVSLLLSCGIGTFINLNEIDPTPFLEKFNISLTLEMVYFIIGFCPELILQQLKKIYGIFQPKSEIEGYKRS